ncbi:hypothetical protein [Geobacter sp.]|uniref:hypothetical protein n=1 Tax=Geobacter sp. TaxID=46610 RepID=UPI0026370D91|nr:hypothetical protein [Geobacter sp.]
MKSLLIVLSTLLLAALALPAQARRGEPADPAVAAEARQSLDGILDLWRAGNYEGVYDRTSVSGRESREAFARKLANASRRPACCWEKMQEVRVTAGSGDAVTIRARFGLEGPGETEYSTRSVRLVREEGGWRVAQADLLALAGAKKKRHRHSRKTYTERGGR